MRNDVVFTFSLRRPRSAASSYYLFVLSSVSKNPALYSVARFSSLFSLHPTPRPLLLVFRPPMELVFVRRNVFWLCTVYFCMARGIISFTIFCVEMKPLGRLQTSLEKEDVSTFE